MNKLEAADKLAEAVAKLLSDNPYLCAYCYQKNYKHSQGCAKQATMKLLETYRQAPAVPPLEKILEAMETLNKVEAADKLAEVVADDLEVDSQETHDKMDLALCDYLNAPPMPSLEKILEALEYYFTFVPIIQTLPDRDKHHRDMLSVLAELRKAVKP